MAQVFCSLFGLGDVMKIKREAAVFDGIDTNRIPALPRRVEILERARDALAHGAAVFVLKARADRVGKGFVPEMFPDECDRVDSLGDKIAPRRSIHLRQTPVRIEHVK